ncbi:N-acetylmuramoyl-L-alanine amidase [Enterococcus italicus]|uniref:N-acetylmuramoyl-L-alanine amidase n=1 Tax=Enterococcus italicus TaxID=246144 RepID=UPI0028B18296|nr:N-acetylmuramoyl-L-alanine amidase [Enterococcus italicus]
MKRKRRRLKKKYRRLLMLILLVLIGFVAVKKVINRTDTQPQTGTTTSVTEEDSVKKTYTKTTYIQTTVDTTNLDSSTATDADYSVSIYESASTASTVVGQTYDGAWSEYEGTDGDFYKVKTEDNLVGYIEKSHGKKATYTVQDGITSLDELTVVLDPGHGGEDVGSLDNSETIYEKTLTLATAKAVKKILEDAGIKVIMTRTKASQYTTLANVANTANDANANLFISFHYDNYDYANQAEGYTTYYYYAHSEAFANAIHSELAASNTLSDRGIQTANYMVLRNSFVPGVLLELGFLNNDRDLATMNTDAYRQMVGEAILSGIKNYYNLSE